MLRIEIVKEHEGRGVLRCTRQDGSVTWEKQTRHAPYFALHDLTHLAVETALGYRQGFFGLVSEGWDIDDTSGKGARGALPGETVEVERLVGLFDCERASGALWSTKELNELAPRALTEAEIQEVRSLRAALFEKWSAVPPGEKLELTFGFAVAPRAQRI